MKFEIQVKGTPKVVLIIKTCTLKHFSISMTTLLSFAVLHRHIVHYNEAGLGGLMPECYVKTRIYQLKCDKQVRRGWGSRLQFFVSLFFE